MSNKALLIRYSSKNEIQLSECIETLALGYLASVLRKNSFGVTILDSAYRYISEQDILDELGRDNYNIIGFTIDDPSNIDATLVLIKKLRSEGINSHITMGGHTPTFGFREILEECHDIDSIVRFEGEETILELARSIERYKDWRDIAGIAFKSNGDIVTNSIRPLITNLNSLPFPERDTLALATKNNHKRASLSSSRGCYGNCIYCSVCEFYGIPQGRKWRARSPINVVNEIESLVNKFAVNEVEFIDDNFISLRQNGKNRAIEIAEEIIKRHIKVMLALYCRADEVNKDVFQRLAEAGLREVLIGIESGVDTILRRIKKGITARQNQKALEILKDLGIYPVIGFIMFDPYTTLEELYENLMFLKSTGLNFLRVSLNLMQPYKGTPINGRLLKEGNLYGDYKEFRYRFYDSRVALVYDILSKTMEGILTLSLKIREVERSLIRQRFPFGSSRNHENYSRQELSIEKSISGIIKKFFDIFEEVLNFIKRSRIERAENLNSFITQIENEVKKFQKESMVLLNLSDLLIKNIREDVKND